MNTFTDMPTKTRSIMVGTFILIAYGVLVSSITQSPLAVMASDIISGLAVIGIALLMFPLFRRADPILPVSYLILKWVEGILMIGGGILFLIPEAREVRNSIYDGIHLYVFIISGAFFYILMLSRKTVPGFISIWGLAGIGALFVKTIFAFAGYSLEFINYFLVLIITNEIFLAIWLFVKGLDTGKEVK